MGGVLLRFHEDAIFKINVYDVVFNDEEETTTTNVEYNKKAEAICFCFAPTLLTACLFGLAPTERMISFSTLHYALTELNRKSDWATR